MVNFYISPQLSISAQAEGKESACLFAHVHDYFLCFHSFIQLSKEEKNSLLLLHAKHSSCFISSNENVFFLMIGSNYNPLASIQGYCFCLRAVCLQQQLAICI